MDRVSPEDVPFHCKSCKVERWENKHMRKRERKMCGKGRCTLKAYVSFGKMFSLGKMAGECFIWED